MIVLPVVRRWMFWRCFSSSSARMKARSMVPRAWRMTCRAFFSLMPAGASSRAVAVARDSMVWKPISCSFLLVAGPTPGRSSKSSYCFLG